jgi:hypothetical protein
MGPWKAFNDIGHRFRAGMVKDYLNSYMKETEADALLILKTNGKNLKLIVEAVEVGEDCVVLQLKKEDTVEDPEGGEYISAERVDECVGHEDTVEVGVEATEGPEEEGVPGAGDQDVSISIIGAAAGEKTVAPFDYDDMLQIGCCIEVEEDKL